MTAHRKELLDSVMTLPSDRMGWRLPLAESKDAPTLPRDLRKMTERQRQSLLQHLQTLPLQDLRRRLDKVHAMQSEAHQHLRYYGTNTAHSLSVANLTIMDETLSRAIEFVEDGALEQEAAEGPSSKYDVREPAWQHKSWVLAAPDEAPVGQQAKPAISRKAIESKYGVRHDDSGYESWRPLETELEEAAPFVDFSPSNHLSKIVSLFFHDADAKKNGVAFIRMKKSDSMQPAQFAKNVKKEIVSGYYGSAEYYHELNADEDDPERRDINSRGADASEKLAQWTEKNLTVTAEKIVSPTSGLPGVRVRVDPPHDKWPGVKNGPK